MRKLIAGAIVSGIALASSSAFAGSAEQLDMFKMPAASLRQLSDASILGAAQSDSRVVAVGQRGVVLISDDYGKTYRQAKSVPIGPALTSVTFATKNDVWAVGHWGTILKSTDRGETWKVQRIDTGNDQPLFSVWFENPQHGYAVGLFSLFLETNDGGNQWQAVKLPKSPDGGRSDLNLYKVFGTAGGPIFIAAEQGTVYVKPAGGVTWEAVATGGKGTLWTGVAIDAQTVVVAGLKGKIYRSTDAGKSWEAATSNATSSITDLIRLANGDIFATALDGVSLRSTDGGKTFEAQRLPAGQALHAVAQSDKGVPLLFPQRGVNVN